MRHVATLRSPLFVHTTKKKTQKGKFILNLNNYRNEFQMKLNKAKIVYKDEMAQQIAALPTIKKAAVRFVMYPGTQRETDTPNVCCIHDKFFMDALVTAGKLEEDHYKFYVETGYTFGAVDKDNPRVEIEIYEVAA